MKTESKLNFCGVMRCCNKNKIAKLSKVNNYIFSLLAALCLCIGEAQAYKVVKCTYNNADYQLQFNKYYNIQQVNGAYVRNRSVIEWLLADNNDVARISMDLIGLSKAKVGGLREIVVKGTIMRPHTLRPISCISAIFEMKRIFTMDYWGTPEIPGVQYWRMDPPLPHRKLILKCSVEPMQPRRAVSDVASEEEEISELSKQYIACPMQGNNDDILKSYEGDEPSAIISSGSSSSSSNSGSSNSGSPTIVNGTVEVLH